MLADADRQTLANRLSEPLSEGQSLCFLIYYFVLMFISKYLNTMTPLHTETLSAQSHDKQLQGIALEAVLEKRRLDQALNAKEFAVCAGVSYSTARSWFHLPGFPAFRGVTFWQDFVQWRAGQNGFASQRESLPHRGDQSAAAASTLPPRAAQILFDA